MKQTGKKRVVFSTMLSDSEQVKLIMAEARLTGRIAKNTVLEDVNRIFKHQQVNFQISLKLLSLVRRYFVTSHHSLHNNTAKLYFQSAWCIMFKTCVKGVCGSNKYDLINSAILIECRIIL